MGTPADATNGEREKGLDLFVDRQW